MSMTDIFYLLYEIYTISQYGNRKIKLDIVGYRQNKDLGLLML